MAPHWLAVSPLGSDKSHVERRRQILARHPEVRSLFGTDTITFKITVSLLVAQLAIAAFVGWLGSDYWPIAVLLAVCFGAFANHANHVVVHDAIHNLVFERRTLNKLTAIIADLPNGFPNAMGFRVYHLKHHSHLSAYDYDADIPSRWEVALVRNIWWRKALWLFFFPVVQLLRVPRLKGPLPLWRPWMFANIAAVIVCDALVYYFLGGAALAYLLLSFWFSIGGLHPLTARWVQEHFAFGPDQGTFGYYGPLNRIALNIGYHNEHHDFHEIPWRRLPELKAMAPAFYDGLAWHGSWSGLLVRFVVDPSVSLYSRSANIEHAMRTSDAGAPRPAM